MEHRLFSPERYYAENKQAYLDALRTVKQTHNLNAWLLYFVVGLATEFERVGQKVRELNNVTRALPLPFQLTEAQERLVAVLTAEPRRTITISEYVQLTGTSGRTASRDLNALVEAGVLEIEARLVIDGSHLQPQTSDQDGQ